MSTPKNQTSNQEETRPSSNPATGSEHSENTETFAPPDQQPTPPSIESEDSTAENTPPPENNIPTNSENIESPTDHALAAATSPAEILTSELLKTEMIIPISATPPTEAIAEEVATAIPQEAPIAEEKNTQTFAENAPPEAEQIPLQELPPTSTPASETESLPLEIVTPTKSDTPKSFLQKVKATLMTPSVLMILSAFLFSSMILFVKLASVHYSSLEIISVRGLIGALCILLFQQFKHGFKKGFFSLKTNYLPMQMWRAFIGTMSMMCWFYGVSKLSLAMATTLSYMSSIWIAIFMISTAFITGSTRPSPKLVFSILLGFGGIIAILRPSGTDIDMLAASIVVISSVFGALAYLQVAALGRVGEPAYRTVFYFSLFGIVFGIIGTIATQGYFSEFSLTGVVWLILIGLLAMLAQFCLTLAYTGGNALVNASLQYSGLIFVIIFDWVLGIGWPDYATWLGMALVVVSGLMATFMRAKQ
ncbi:MAG: EamA family transporter [Saezia sp.]